MEDPGISLKNGLKNLRNPDNLRVKRREKGND